MQIPGEIDFELYLLQTDLESLEQRTIYHFGIDDIRRAWKGEDVYVEARVSFSKEAYRMGYKQAEIAQFLGLADHSTVSRYIRYEGKVRPAESKIRAEEEKPKKVKIKEKKIKEKPKKSKESWYDKIMKSLKDIV